MPLQLWLGGSGSGKSHRLYETIIKEAGEHADRNYLILVPEQFTLQTQRDIVMLHPDGGIINIDILGFNRLSYRIFEEVGFDDGNGIVVDDMGKNLILRHLAGEHADDLKVIGKNLKRLGYITEIKSVISEFMQYGVSNDKIAKLKELAKLNNRRLLGEKLDDIEIIYDAFRDYIKDKYTTTEELLGRASKALAKSQKLKDSVIILDGFTGFTPVQYDFIEEAMKVCKDIHVTVLADTYRGFDNPYDENDLFFMSFKTVRELKHIAETNHISVNKDIVISDEIPIRYRLSDTSPQMLISLEKNIFRPENNNNCYDSEKLHKYGISTNSVNGDIQILSALNPLQEMTYVAVLINDLVRTKGYRYKDIAIVSGELDTYRHAADRIFDCFNIPYFIDKKQAILLNPFIEFMRSMMRVLIENYSFDAMFSYLKSSLCGYDTDTINELENYCLAMGIKGKKKWHNKFIRHEKNASEDNLIGLNAIREVAIEPFSLFDECESVRDYSEALYNVLVRFEIQQQLKNKSEIFKKEGKDALSKEYSTVYASVIELLEKLVDLLGDEKMDISEYYELLNAGFDELRIGLVPQNTDYVQIGDLTRSRFRDIKALFFVGVNEGIVPASNSSGGILSDIDREFFSANGAGVELAPTSRMQSYTQRLYLYMVMTKPKERLYISYSKITSDGEAISPSYLIGEIKGLFPKIKVSDFSEIPLSQRACSEETALKELALSFQKYIKKYDDITDANAAECDKLFEYFAQNGKYQNSLVSLIYSAFADPNGALTNSVTSKIAHVIYGNTIYGSITRLEMYARCAYEHFLQYGLKLKEREEFKFDMRDMGSAFHEVLEVFSGLLSENGYTWASINEEDAIALTKDAVLTVTNANAAIYDTERSSYLVNRIERIMVKSVLTLRNHVLMGDFIPSKFEYEFIEASDLSSINFKLNETDRLRLTGRIDRMDLYEDDSSIYVKIIDFKSSQKDLDLAAVYRGEQLQLVVYLNAAMESLKKSNPDKEIIPAGILYYRLDDPVIEPEPGDEEAVIKAKILKELKMKGLVNSDEEIIRHMDRDISGSSNVIPVSINKDNSVSANSAVVSEGDFKVISEYVNNVITDMGRKMLEGNIAISPKDCDYCAYSSICKHANMKAGREAKLSRDEALEKMRESLNISAKDQPSQ